MKILLLNRTFYPDVAATAQHAADLASELAARGHDVTVIAGRRAYDDPDRQFAKQETWLNVRIIRIPHSYFGKSSRWRRAADFATFLIACAMRVSFLPHFDVVIALTSPPLVSLVGAIATKLKGGRFIYWVMDLNPDEAIAAGWLRKNSCAGIILNVFSRYTLRVAHRIIVLDRFMQKRIGDAGIAAGKIRVIPPWAHDRVIRYDPDGRLAFRKTHRLANKFVIMYSGNHSPCHPLDTLLEAARTLAARPEFVFCFVGGGSYFRKVYDYASQHNLTNMLFLPYQPLNKLSASLSSADLHVVVMGNAFAGIVHPSKIYNILNLGTPLLYVGPTPSHVTDLVPENAHGRWFYHAEHGSAAALVHNVLEAHKSAARRTRDEIRVAATFSQRVLIPELIEEIELGHLRPAAEPGLSLTA